MKRKVVLEKSKVIGKKAVLEQLNQPAHDEGHQIWLSYGSSTTSTFVGMVKWGFGD